MTEYKVLDIEHMTQSDILRVIMPGDVVRFTGPGEHDITTRQVTEDNGVVVVLGECTYTLKGLSEGTGDSIEITGVLRPIPGLPTGPGYYESARYPLKGGYFALRLNAYGEWYRDGVRKTEEQMCEHMPLNRLVPETTPAKLRDRIDLDKMAEFLEHSRAAGDSWRGDAAAIIAAIDGGELDK